MGASANPSPATAGAVAPGRASRRLARARRPRGTKGETRTLLGLALPALVLYGAFLAIPVLFSFYYALTAWDGFAPPRFIGMENFRELAQDDTVVRAFRNTAVLTAVVVVGQNVLGLGLALLLNRRFRGVSAFRALFFAPALLSTAVVALVWGFVFSPLVGVLPTVLEALGLPASGVRDVLGDPNLALFAVAGTLIWQYAGYLMIIYIAGLQAIGSDVYDAAAMDGARGWSRFRYITLPLLRPATAVAVTISVIGNLRLFDHVWLMTGGGPAGATETAGTLIYRTAFTSQRFGYAAAQAVVLTLVICVVAGAQRWFIARRSVAA